MVLKHYSLLSSKRHICISTIHLFGLILLVFTSTNVMGQKTLAEKLGYPKDAKLLIIHADDLGVSHSENSASIRALEEGAVNSASVMMPTPWVLEIANYAKENTGKHDLGLHLVLTSEWKNYKWRPVATTDKVISLTNDEGFFFKDCPSQAEPKAVEAELRAQIELAYSMGINPTHLDSHMGCLFWTNRAFFEIYVKLAKAYNLPFLVDKSFAKLYPDQATFKGFLKEQKVTVLIDSNLTISPEEYKNGTATFYTQAIKSMKPGLTQFLIHTAYNTAELKAMTKDHPEWGATWRQADFDFFISAACKQLLKEEHIILVTWREISKALAKK